MNARTSSISSIGGGKMLYILGIGFEKDIAFALILNMPDETLTKFSFYVPRYLLIVQGGFL